MFNLFKPKSKLGIDIGTSSIKITEFSKSGGRFVLENYGIFDLKDMISDFSMNGQGVKLPDEEIVWGLKEILKNSGIKSRDVVTAMPSISTFATVIEMPYLSEDDLAKAIPFEARKYVPIPLDEVVLDWSIIGVKDQNGNVVPEKSQAPAGGTIVEIFLAAVPKDETVRYQRIMKDAGLNLVALELENLALIRGLLGNDLSATAIVNIGGRSTSIVVVDGGYERVSHNYEIGGFEMTKAISRALGVGLDKAEDLKRKFGLTDTPDNVAKEAMLSLVDMMIFETNKTIGGYEESRGHKVARVVLAGGLSNMPNFINYFKKRLNRDVFVGNAFSRVVYPQKLAPIIQELSNTLSISAGLAMRDI
jgi:type IV pilus assembly protein PilM